MKADWKVRRLKLKGACDRSENKDKTVLKLNQLGIIYQI